MSSKKLRSMLLPQPQPQDHDRKLKNIHIRARLEPGEVIGHVFATSYSHQQTPVVWVTQLVVHSGYRNIGVAKSMLGLLGSEFKNADGEDEDEGGEKNGRGLVGILSSHPFATRSVLSVFGELDLEVIKTCAKDIMKSCPVDYVKDANLRGSLFEDQGERWDPKTVERDGEGVVCCADTGFFVDHGEPERALRLFEEKGRWVLGSLPEGCEFLAIVKPKW